MSGQADSLKSVLYALGANFAIALTKSGDRHSPNAKSWTDRVKDLFK